MVRNKRLGEWHEAASDRPWDAAAKSMFHTSSAICGMHTGRWREHKIARNCTNGANRLADGISDSKDERNQSRYLCQ